MVQVRRQPLPSTPNMLCRCSGRWLQTLHAHTHAGSEASAVVQRQHVVSAPNLFNTCRRWQTRQPARCKQAARFKTPSTSHAVQSISQGFKRRPDTRKRPTHPQGAMASAFIRTFVRRCYTLAHTCQPLQDALAERTNAKHAPQPSIHTAFDISVQFC